ncbi:MAG: heme ABC exporter ATP-binding protein CcmA [Alphaproteobacteria bacterium HGW-Alphaproteobacteria-2]|nr:MAG: heme ABC exporter ATP-binding protein CcmA [Alphaproteobacteria bacterium HGW-Alphaproteobacteria-2]
MIRAEGLACRRGDLAVIEGLSFTLDAGECLILRGPNGSGKTTLLRVLAGLAPPEAGRIGAGEETVVYAGHADGIKAQLTVAENLGFWARVYGGPFALTDLADRQAQHLSAGQKRRLGLARLLVCGRPVWALDEPTVSLDAATVARFAEVVGAHCAGGGAAIIATHVDLGIPGARLLDIAPYRARPGAGGSPFLDTGFDAAFAGSGA